MLRKRWKRCQESGNCRRQSQPRWRSRPVSNRRSQQGESIWEVGLAGGGLQAQENCLKGGGGGGVLLKTCRLWQRLWWCQSRWMVSVRSRPWGSLDHTSQVVGQGPKTCRQQTEVAVTLRVENPPEMWGNSWKIREAVLELMWTSLILPHVTI